ncbi:hypothetical protein [Polynucleobacter sp. 39-46-10]|jgi:hypothetical protein|uniref:hypothetical protein n=1 Tax=Polynucleobacter sp. 39-46-10 TaxID=1970428 RepID=UPI000BCAA9BD|nr:hypothetical protein [Polynucleobacter sp. 39-46-10]OZA76646.1 MAG: hypothetical protein B7X71_07650 [Polynucleobacter sp. 39-46-10]
MFAQKESLLGGKNAREKSLTPGWSGGDCQYTHCARLAKITMIRVVILNEDLLLSNANLNPLA